MKRLIWIVPFALLVGSIIGCNDTGKQVEPKSQGTPDPNLKRVNQQPSTGGPGPAQPAPQGGGTPKPGASEN